MKTFSFGHHGANCNGAIEEPSECPICKKKIKPHEMTCSDYKNETGDWFVSCMYLCKGCYQTFIVLHDVEITEHSKSMPFNPTKFTSSCLYVEPNKHQKRIFPADMAVIKSSFGEVYDQASKAESMNLLEICGAGYRKALEFLVRDFLLYLYPNDKEKMQGMELGNLIANKVPIEKIKTSASRCAWLGNDHSHYYKKFEDKDLSDLKRLFDAVVYWVSMELATEDASGMDKR